LFALKVNISAAFVHSSAVRDILSLMLKARTLFSRLFGNVSISVRAVLHDGQSNVLLVRHTYIDGLYLPGGGIKRGESVLSAIFRELREEVGFRDQDAISWDVVGIFLNDYSGMYDHVVLFDLKVDPKRLNDMTSAASGVSSEISHIVVSNIHDLPDSLSPGSRRRLQSWFMRQDNFVIGSW
jgi:ADP-ribose pyrophosphatase YjhB (NUDIX family)